MRPIQEQHCSADQSLRRLAKQQRLAVGHCPRCRGRIQDSGGGGGTMRIPFATLGPPQQLWFPAKRVGKRCRIIEQRGTVTTIPKSMAWASAYGFQHCTEPGSDRSLTLWRFKRSPTKTDTWNTGNRGSVQSGTAKLGICRPRGGKVYRTTSSCVSVTWGGGGGSEKFHGFRPYLTPLQNAEHFQ